MNVITLKRLQHLFKEGMKAGNMSPEGHALIRESRTFAVDQRVQVYHDGFWIRMHGSFADDFSRVKAFLGDSLFDKSVSACVQKYPSRSWSLGEVSQNYSKIVALRKYSGSLPFLKDLAEWEWQQTKLALVASPEIFDFSELAKSSAKEIEDLELRANPTVIYVRTHWNLTLKRPRRSKRLLTFALFKGGQRIRSVQVSKNENALLKYLSRPRSLAEITRFLEKKKLRSTKVTQLFSGLVQHQLLIKA
jgi:hypothetical protein